jgi:hypothetical protein
MQPKQEQAEDALVRLRGGQPSTGADGEADSWRLRSHSDGQQDQQGISPQSQEDTPAPQTAWSGYLASFVSESNRTSNIEH